LEAHNRYITSLLEQSELRNRLPPNLVTSTSNGAQAALLVLQQQQQQSGGTAPAASPGSAYVSPAGPAGLSNGIPQQPQQLQQLQQQGSAGTGQLPPALQLQLAMKPELAALLDGGGAGTATAAATGTGGTVGSLTAFQAAGAASTTAASMSAHLAGSIMQPPSPGTFFERELAEAAAMWEAAAAADHGAQMGKQGHEGLLLPQLGLVGGEGQGDEEEEEDPLVAHMLAAAGGGLGQQDGGLMAPQDGGGSSGIGQPGIKRQRVG
jgi:hypothetical protein